MVKLTRSPSGGSQRASGLCRRPWSIHLPKSRVESVRDSEGLLTWSKSPLGEQRSVDCKTRKTLSHGEEKVSSRQRVSNWQRQSVELQVKCSCERKLAKNVPDDDGEM